MFNNPPFLHFNPIIGLILILFEAQNIFIKNQFQSHYRSDFNELDYIDQQYQK